mmetsp:Transcript_32937/g.104412  ORF Transcript_32937/g.104412 Transcript_32937/m.104412 type:complete len:219 (+) Transcript_32937:572-1228(+)
MSSGAVNPKVASTQMRPCLAPLVRRRWKAATSPSLGRPSGSQTPAPTVFSSSCSSCSCRCCCRCSCSCDPFTSFSFPFLLSGRGCRCGSCCRGSCCCGGRCGGPSCGGRCGSSGCRSGGLRRPSVEASGAGLMMVPTTGAPSAMSLARMRHVGSKSASQLRTGAAEGPADPWPRGGRTMASPSINPASRQGRARSSEHRTRLSDSLAPRPAISSWSPT